MYSAGTSNCTETFTESRPWIFTYVASFPWIFTSVAGPLDLHPEGGGGDVLEPLADPRRRTTSLNVSSSPSRGH